MTPIVTELSTYLVDMLLNEVDTLTEQGRFPTIEHHDAVLGVVAANVLAAALANHDIPTCEALYATFENTFRTALAEVREAMNED